MKTIALLAALAVAFCLGGCSASSVGNPPEIPVPEIPGIDPNAGVEDAKSLAWPFAWAGFIGLLGCIVIAIVIKRIPWDAFIAAIVIGLVPVLVFLFLKPLILPVCIVCCFLGLCVCVYAGYKTYDLIEDDIQADKEKRT